MPRSCKSKQALLHGIRPSSHQKIHCGVCSRRCIFCDIWKLATLVYTHIPLSSRYNTSSSRLQKQSTNAYDYERSEKMIEAQFNTQRVRLASIMSICTVDGAEESEGLRIAHDRCFTSVKELLYQEAVLEEALIRPIHTYSHATPTTQLPEQSFARRSSRDQGKACGVGRQYYNQGRRPSLVGTTA